MTLTFTIPGKLRAWQRNNPGFRRQDKDKAYRHKVAQCAAMARPKGWRPPEMVRVELVVVHPRPGRCPAKVPGPAWATGQRLPRPTIGKDDADRMAGNVLDGLSDARIYADDGLVVALLVEKFWAAEGEAAHALVTVQAVGWYDDAAP